MPSLKKGMSTFVGCAIGYPRLGLWQSAFESDKVIQSLFKQGLLSATTEDGRVWLALTVKGKQHVTPMEKYWSQL
jgi:hypothetical protein